MSYTALKCNQSAFCVGANSDALAMLQIIPPSFRVRLGTHAALNGQKPNKNVQRNGLQMRLPPRASDDFIEYSPVE